MNNIDFIKEYGKKEFYNMCKDIEQELYIAKAQKQIGHFKTNNSKKKVKFYIKDEKDICLEYAMIYNIGCSNIKKYIENICEERKKYETS